MKPLFLRKKSVWYSIIVTGVLFVTIGLFQLTMSIREYKGVHGGGPLNPVSRAGESTVTSDDKKSYISQRGTQIVERKPNEYFVNYRLDRDRTRSQLVDWWREIVNNPQSPEETKKEAQKKILAITQLIDTEMKLENLIKAENFKDVVVFIEDKSVTVIVQIPVLTSMDRQKITEITSRITGFSQQNIVIIPKV